MLGSPYLGKVLSPYVSASISFKMLKEIADLLIETRADVNFMDPSGPACSGGGELRRGSRDLGLGFRVWGEFRLWGVGV